MLICVDDFISMELIGLVTARFLCRYKSLNVVSISFVFYYQQDLRMLFIQVICAILTLKGSHVISPGHSEKNAFVFGAQSGDNQSPYLSPEAAKLDATTRCTEGEMDGFAKGKVPNSAAEASLRCYRRQPLDTVDAFTGIVTRGNGWFFLNPGLHSLGHALHEYDLHCVRG